jgi:uncharacterized protein (TIGR02145 family)
MRWILVIKDMDGNSYKTVKIGNQVWTSENWRSTKYKDGTSIPLIADANIWKNLITPGYCWYNNGTSNAYGALYNWYAVSTGKLAPAGWHVPSAAEWDTLQNYLTAHGYNWDSSVMINKVAQSMAAQQDWPVSLIAGCIGYNLSKNNRSGFSALPGGYRMGSTFDSFGIFGYWWTSTQTGTSSTASCRGLHYNADYLGNANHALTDGYSVRLVKD